MIPAKSKSTRVSLHIQIAHTVSVIDNTITNCAFNSDFKSAIIKTVGPPPSYVCG